MTRVPAGCEDLWPGSRLSRRPGRAGLLVLPSARRPRMLVPTGLPAARVMLSRNATSRAQTLGQHALATGIRTGVLALLPVARLVTDPAASNIEGHVRARVPDTARLGVLLGPPRANAKPVLQAFAADGRTVAFGKVGYDPATAALVRREGDVLGDPALRGLEHVDVPEVLSTDAFEGLAVLLLSPLSAAQSRSRSWELPLAATHEVAESGGTARAAVVGSEYWAGLVRRRDGLDSAHVGRFVTLLDELAPLVAGTSLGFGRWHGDWSPWNMGRSGGRVQVWDWEQSRLGVPLGLDAVHFTMQGQFRRRASAAEAVRTVLDEATTALARWYPAGEQVEVTVLLYVAEITERYLSQVQAQAGPTPQLARRLSLLEEVADLLVRSRRAAIAAGGTTGRGRSSDVFGVVGMMRLPTIVGERDPIMRAGHRAALGAVIGAVVGLLVTGLLYLRLPVQYSSTVALELTSVTPLVDLNPTGPRIDSLTIDTDAVMTASDPVVAAVAQAVGRDEVDVRSAMSVRARPQSRVLEITYTTATSPDAAREGVTAAAEAYLDLREQLIIQPVRTYVDGVVAATDAVQSDPDLVGDQVARGQAALERRLERAEAYEIALPVPGSVIASASVPTARRGVLDVALMSGTLLGALVGFGLGLLWERRAHRRHRHPQVATAAGTERPRELARA